MASHITVGTAIGIAVHVTIHMAIRITIGLTIHVAIHVGPIWVVVVVRRHRVTVSNVEITTLIGENQRYRTKHQTKEKREKAKKRETEIKNREMVNLRWAADS